MDGTLSGRCELLPETAGRSSSRTASLPFLPEDGDLGGGVAERRGPLLSVFALWSQL